MGKTRLEVLQNSFEKIIENQAFMFADVVDSLEFEVEEYIQLSINFIGKVTGVIKFTTNYEMGKELASSILGLDFDEEPSKEDIIDSLQELLNVTCGNFVTELEGTDSVFDLSIPKQETINKDTLSDVLKDSNSIKFSIDDFPFIVSLTVNI